MVTLRRFAVLERADRFGSPTSRGHIINGAKKSDADELVHPGETLGRDADDRELDAAELHAAAEDRRVGAELLFPQHVAEDDDRIAARDLILVRPEVAPQLRLDAHHREEVAADEQAERQLRQRVPGRGESGREAAERDQTVEARAAVADVDVLAVRRVEAG